MVPLSHLFAASLFAFWGLLIWRLLPRAWAAHRAVALKKRRPKHAPPHPHPHRDYAGLAADQG